MYKKLLIFGCVGVCCVMLSGCSKTSDSSVSTGDVRQSFYITTQLIGSTQSKGTITKNAKVLGVSDITVTSQVAGRINRIGVGLGQDVGQSTLLVGITDTNGTISFGLQKNQIAFDSASNTFEVQKANLEKQISDAQIALRRAELSAELTRNDTDKQLQKIDYDLSTVNPLFTGSNTQIQLDSLRKQLEKAQFDYQTKLTADDQTLDGMILTAKNMHTDISNLMTDIITESDKILGVSDERKSYNDSYESVLGSKDFSSKIRAEEALRTLIAQRDELRQLGQQNTSITMSNVVNYLQSYRTIITAMNTLISSMKYVVNATTPSISLNQSALDVMTNQYNAMATRSSAITSSITAQVNSITAFMSTYQQNQQSLAQQVDLLKSQIALTEKSLNDAQFNTQLGGDRTKLSLNNQLAQSDLNLESTKIATDFVSSTKDLNLESIRNQLKSAEIALQELRFNAAKFNVQSPIRGIVSDVLVDVGQDVSPGTPLLRIVSNQQELELSLTESEKQFITLGQKVTVFNQSQSTYGTVSSISTTADRNGNFIAKISIDDPLFDVGVFVDVSIELQQGNALVPVNSVSIVDTNRGQITLFTNGELTTKTVQLGSLFGEMIEVVSPIEKGSVLVTSDISNYDPDKQRIVLDPIVK